MEIKIIKIIEIIVANAINIIKNNIMIIVMLQTLDLIAQEKLGKAQSIINNSEQKIIENKNVYFILNNKKYEFIRK